MSKKLKILAPNAKFSIETISKEIISSNDINIYLDDGTNLVKERSLPNSTLNALSSYLGKILNRALKAKNLGNTIKNLKSDEVALINQKTLPFFRISEEKKILINIKDSENLLDSVFISMNMDRESSLRKEIIAELSSKFTSEYVYTILDGIIPNLEVPQVIDREYVIGKEIYSVLIQFYLYFIEVISNKLNVNILLFIPTMNIIDTALKTFYISKIRKGIPFIAVKVVIPFLSKIPRSVVNKVSVNKIYYENIAELNVPDHSINYKLSDSIIANIKGELGIKTSLDSDIASIGDEIVFDPLDREGLLKVIEIPITDKINKTFLLGKSGNLYEDDDDTNDLVGKLHFIDKVSFNTRIYWSKNYLENLGVHTNK